MSIENQIARCEERISQLEDSRLKQAAADLENIEQDLARAYQQIALLKIRRMMNY